MEWRFSDGKAEAVGYLNQLLSICIANQEEKFLAPVTAKKIIPDYA